MIKRTEEFYTKEEFEFMKSTLKLLGIPFTTEEDVPDKLGVFTVDKVTYECTSDDLMVIAGCFRTSKRSVARITYPNGCCSSGVQKKSL